MAFCGEKWRKYMDQKWSVYVFKPCNLQDLANPGLGVHGVPVGPTGFSEILGVGWPWWQRPSGLSRALQLAPLQIRVYHKEFAVNEPPFSPESGWSYRRTVSFPGLRSCRSWWVWRCATKFPAEYSLWGSPARSAGELTLITVFYKGHSSLVLLYFSNIIL